MNQSKTPLWTALKAYAEDKIIPFHTPGHKLQSGPFNNIEKVLGEGFFSIDPSDEISSYEYNNDFEIALHHAEQLAAELFGSKESLFLINGTTGGLHYLLMPATGPVIIPRFSHQAVYSGLMLSEGKAVYLPTDYEPDWAIPLPPSLEQVKKVLSKSYIQALVITYPTYYGTTSELKTICNLAKENDVLVFVDEAHGGHFLFSDKLPKTALECGADATVQSTHKTLGSFTQTSMLFSNHADWFSKVVQSRNVLQTTSPSLVFLGILDEVRKVLARDGEYLIERTIELAQFCADELAKIEGVRLLPANLQSDPTKIVFSLRDLGITGIELEHILRKNYKLQLELSDYYSVLALVTIGDTVESVSKLIWAIKDLVQRKTLLGNKSLPQYKLHFPNLPPAILSLRSSFFAEKETIPLSDAKGRICGEFLTPYPPGVPVVVPGEKITQDIVEYLLWCRSINWPVRGLMEGGKVTVLKDNNAFSRKLR